jgi:hypothetical protein
MCQVAWFSFVNEYPTVICQVRDETAAFLPDCTPVIGVFTPKELAREEPVQPAELPASCVFVGRRQLQTFYGPTFASRGWLSGSARSTVQQPVRRFSTRGSGSFPVGLWRPGFLRELGKSAARTIKHLR